MDNYTTLDFIFYGSETNSFFGTILHLGLIGTAGYFTGKYVAPVVWEAITKDSKDSSPSEKQVYVMPDSMRELPAAPTLSYGG